MKSWNKRLLWMPLLVREKMKPLFDKYTKELGEDLVKLTFAELERGRASK